MLLLNTAFIYLAAGLLAGLFYREFTKANDFPAGQFTQLGVVHTHLLVLGFVMFLILLALEKLFVFSRNTKLFAWFYGLYNLGVVLTAGMMIVHGILTVLGKDSSAAISGIAGLGHIAITAATIVFFVATRRAVTATQERPENLTHS